MLRPGDEEKEFHPAGHAAPGRSRGNKTFFRIGLNTMAYICKVFS